jgi:hypothetical protein
MIFSIASASILALGIYTAWRADRETGRSETTVAGQYLGGLLIVGGLVLIGTQLTHAFGPITVVSR